MTACCWPQERGLTSHTLACILRPPHIRAVPNPPPVGPPERDGTPPQPHEAPESAESNHHAANLGGDEGTDRA